MITVTLQWPDPKLNPNKRLHWAPKAKATKAARERAFWLTTEQLRGKQPVFQTQIMIDVEFYPPDRRKRDRTNCEAMMKAYFDGMADALKVNDIRFSPRYTMRDPVPGGKITVNIN